MSSKAENHAARPPLAASVLAAAVPDDLAADWQQQGVVWQHEPTAAIAQLQAIGLSRVNATAIYARSWLKPNGHPRPRSYTPFAVTDPAQNFGHAISFATAPQITACFSHWQPQVTPESQLATQLDIWRLIAGHEMGHHHAVRLGGKIIALANANLSAVPATPFDCETPSSTLATEAFCDMFGIMRLLRDRPRASALRAVTWQAAFRRLRLVDALAHHAQKRWRDQPDRPMLFDVRYYTHGISEYALQNLKALQQAARRTTSEAELADCTTETLRPLLPVVDGEARGFRLFAERHLRTAATRRHLLAGLRRLDAATVTGSGGRPVPSPAARPRDMIAERLYQTPEAA